MRRSGIGYFFIKANATLSFSSKLEELISNPPASSNSSDETVDPYDEIRKLKALLDDGIITEEDFNAKKKQLLGI